MALFRLFWSKMAGIHNLLGFLIVCPQQHSIWLTVIDDGHRLGDVDGHRLGDVVSTEAFLYMSANIPLESYRNDAEAELFSQVVASQSGKSV